MLRIAPTYLQYRLTLDIEDYRLKCGKKAESFLTPLTAHQASDT